MAALAAYGDDFDLEAVGFRRHQDVLADGAAFLDQKSGAVRAAVLRSGDAAAAAAAAGAGQLQGGGGSRAASAADVRRMMGGDAGSAAAAAAATEEDEGGERLEYSRKSIRKLVGDMVARGWRPLPVSARPLWLLPAVWPAQKPLLGVPAQRQARPSLPSLLPAACVRPPCRQPSPARV
jgi:hypothetical protein